MKNEKGWGNAKKILELFLEANRHRTGLIEKIETLGGRLSLRAAWCQVVKQR